MHNTCWGCAPLWRRAAVPIRVQRGALTLEARGRVCTCATAAAGTPRQQGLPVVVGVRTKRGRHRASVAKAPRAGIPPPCCGKPFRRWCIYYAERGGSGSAPPALGNIPHATGNFRWVGYLVGLPVGRPSKVEGVVSGVARWCAALRTPAPRAKRLHVASASPESVAGVVCRRRPRGA